MSDRRLYAISVSIEDTDDSDLLLSLASVLHRRAIDSHRAELTPATRGRRTFTATFSATSRQAATLRASFDNLIHVCEVVLSDVADDAPII